MQAIETLNGNLNALSQRDREFGASLISQFRRKGNLSDRQWPWVDTLNQRARASREPAQVESLGAFGGVFELLQTANANLQWPKIRLQTRSGHQVAVHISGPRSRTPGQIMVTNGESRASGNNFYYGRIDGDGDFTAGHMARADQARLDEVTEVLCELAQDPVTVAAEYGKLTGQCCFCRKTLGEGEDKRSIEVGYGPTCAKNYGLPWGG